MTSGPVNADADETAGDDEPEPAPDPTTSESTGSEHAESATARFGRYARTTKARADELREQATEHLEHLEEERDRHAVYDVLFAMRDEDRRIAGRELAAALAYRLFFLTLPLVLVFVGGLGVAADRGDAAKAVRESGASAAVARTIADATAELSFLQHVGVLIIGVVGTWFAGIGLAKTLTRANELAFELPQTKLVDRTRGC